MRCILHPAVVLVLCMVFGLVREGNVVLRFGEQKAEVHSSESVDGESSRKDCVMVLMMVVGRD